jgi:hypothetical protein
MSGGRGGRPQVIDKTVTCGVIDYIDAFDAAANPVRDIGELTPPGRARADGAAGRGLDTRSATECPGPAAGQGVGPVYWKM